MAATGADAAVRAPQTLPSVVRELRQPAVPGPVPGDLLLSNPALLMFVLCSVLSKCCAPEQSSIPVGMQIVIQPHPEVPMWCVTGSLASPLRDVKAARGTWHTRSQAAAAGTASAGPLAAASAANMEAEAMDCSESPETDSAPAGAAFTPCPRPIHHPSLSYILAPLRFSTGPHTCTDTCE